MLEGRNHAARRGAHMLAHEARERGAVATTQGDDDFFVLVDQSSHRIWEKFAAYRTRAILREYCRCVPIRLLFRVAAASLA